MLTRFWNRIGHRLGINRRPQRRRSLVRGSSLEHLEPRALLAAQVSGMVTPPAATQTQAAAARPQQVTRLDGYLTGPGQLELRWNGGAGAEEFVIRQGRLEIGRVSDDAHSFVVQGLATGQTHRFTVEARNDFGSRTTAREIWVPGQALPTLDDLSVTVSNQGIYTLHLANPRTQDVLNVSYETQSGRYLLVFEPGQTSVRLNGVARGSDVLQFQVSADRARYGVDYSVRSAGEYQLTLPPLRRDLL